MDRKASQFLMLCCAAGLTMAACAGKKGDSELTEIEKASLAVSTEEQNKLLSDANRTYSQGLYTLAREAFERLLNSYPGGPYTQVARIKIADSYFAAGGYLEAAKSYEAFHRDFPISPASDYVLFQAGRSYQLAGRGPGRNPAPLESAISNFERLLAQYPQSRHRAYTEKYRQEARLDLAQHEKRIIAYYRKRGPQKSYQQRQLSFGEKWSDLLAAGLLELPE